MKTTLIEKANMELARQGLAWAEERLRIYLEDGDGSFSYLDLIGVENAIFRALNRIKELTIIS